MIILRLYRIAFFTFFMLAVYSVLLCRMSGGNKDEDCNNDVV